MEERWKYQIEKTTELTSQLASRASPQPAFTQHVEDSERSPSPASVDTNPGINYTSHTRSQPCRSCGNCGSPSHMSRAPTCPARGQTCQRCRKDNHFAKVCRSALAVVGPRTGPRQAGASSSAPTPIHSVSSGLVSFKMCTVELDGVCVPLLLDTGAALSLLNWATVKFPAPHHAADAFGCSPWIWQFKDRLSGLPQLFQVSSKWEQRWPALFSGLGFIKVEGWAVSDLGRDGARIDIIQNGCQPWTTI